MGDRLTKLNVTPNNVAIPTRVLHRRKLTWWSGVKATELRTIMRMYYIQKGIRVLTIYKPWSDDE